MATNLTTLPTGQLAWLIVFQWWTQTRRYAVWERPLFHNGLEYQPLPKVAINFGNQQGGTEDVPVDVTLPRTVEPAPGLTTGRAHAPTTCSIWECDASNVDETARLVYRGRVHSAHRNPAGRTNQVRIRLEGPKSRLKVPLGIIATTTCVWRFGGPQCRREIETESGTIAGIGVDGDVSRIEITGLSTLSNDHWSRGWVEVNGLRIMIRASNGDGTFDLARIPPADWINQTATVSPGCSGTIEQCRFWENESNFGAIGIAMPAYNPVFETR